MSDVSTEEKAIVILSKIGGLLSMIGSFLILRDVVLRYREKREVSLTSTLVFKLSIADFCSSFFGPFVGTWMVPKETGAFLAAGSMASCTAQGFLNVTFYSASVMCNVSLAMSYCLIVKKGWKDNRSNNICNALLRALPMIGVLFSVGPLIDDAFNFTGYVTCDIEPYPPNCDLAGSPVECTRGKHASSFAFLLLAVLVLANVVIMASVVMLIHSVFKLERKMDAYSPDGQVSRTNTLKTTWQGVWYIAAFALAWWPFILLYLTKIIIGDLPKAMRFATTMTWPAQGSYNAFVYFRPKYLNARERHRDDTRLQSLSRVLRWHSKQADRPKDRPRLDLQDNVIVPV